MIENEILLETTITIEDFCKLRKLVGFQPLTAEQAKIVLANTSFLLSASYNGHRIGIVRILTDMITDAYITDVIVHPQFQGKGIGKLLITQALSSLKRHSHCNKKLACTLYANQRKETFYEKYGFQRLPNDKYGSGMMIEL